MKYSVLNGDRPAADLAASAGSVISDRTARINTAIATVQNNPIGLPVRLHDTPAAAIVDQAAGVKPAVPAVSKDGLGSVLADGAIVSTANEKLFPRAQAVWFTPFRVRLWSRRTGAVIKSSTAAGGIGDLGLVKGRYVLTFNVPNTPAPALVAFEGRHPLRVIGKKVEIEKVLFEPGRGANDLGMDLARLTMQVNVIENLLPLLALIGAAGAGLGLAGFGLADALESADKVVASTGDLVKDILIFGGIGIVAVKVFKLDRWILRLFKGGK